jgi:protoporphyrinogen oxidase
VSRVVVLGAGLTGLAAAYHLSRQGVAATVLEKGERPGGACRTIVRDGFHFDLTGHLLHLGRPESVELLKDVGIHAKLRSHRRRAGIALAGTVTPYPIQINTYRLPPEIRRDCLLGFIEAHLRAHDAEEQTKHFGDWVRSRFGEGFARHFFFPYNRKLFCTDPAELTTEWVGRYVPRPELADVVDGALGLYRKSVGYNASFLYPRHGGIQLLADALATHVPVRLATAVRAVHLRSRELALESGETLGWDTLVATAPLSHLAAMTTDLSDEASEAVALLRAVAVVNFNLGVRGAAPRREHWLYVPEERFPFYRVGIPSNHGDVAPHGCHTLSVEVSVPAGTQAPADLPEACLAGLEELGLLRRRSDVVLTEQVRLDPAYVLFDAARPAAVAALRGCLRAAGVVLAGRWAEWKYSTMEDALWDGAAVARRVTA